MRYAVLVSLVMAACTADNPDYCGPRGWRDCPQAYIYVQPDLYGYVLAPDMTVLPDLSHPDLAPPPDLVPPPDLLCGLPYDNKNCGTCGNVCGKGTACSEGKCVACVAYCGPNLGEVCCPDADYRGGTIGCVTGQPDDHNVCELCGALGFRCCPDGSCSGRSARCIDGRCK